MRPVGSRRTPRLPPPGRSRVPDVAQPPGAALVPRADPAPPLHDAQHPAPGTRHAARGTRHAGYAPRPPGTPTAAAGSLALPAPPHPRPRARNPHPISPLARDHWARAPPRTRDQRTGHQPPEPPLPSCHPTSRARSRHSRHELALRGSRATFGHVVPAPRTSWAVSRGWHGLIALVVTASLAVPLTLIFTGGADANSGQTGEALSLGVRLWRCSATAPSRATWSCSPLLRCRCGAHFGRPGLARGAAGRAPGDPHHRAGVRDRAGAPGAPHPEPPCPRPSASTTSPRGRPSRRGCCSGRADLVVDGRGRLRVPLASLVYIFTQGAFTRSWT